MTEPAVVERRNCPLGCHPWDVRDEFPNGIHRLKRCPNCSVVFVSPLRPEIQELYSESYFENKYDQLWHSGYVDTELADAKSLECLNRARMLCRTTSGRPDRLLDIGCGTGRFLELAQVRGWQVEGVELCAAVAERTSRRLGVKVHVGDAERIAITEQLFDVVTLFDVIEHLESPMRALEICRQALKPGGVLALTTPNFNGLGRRLVGQNAFGIWPDEHLVYFSPVTLQFALKKAGFKDIRINTRDIYPENAAMIVGRRRGTREPAGSAPINANASVIALKRIVRGSRMARAIRSSVNEVFKHVPWGDQLLCFATRD